MNARSSAPVTEIRRLTQGKGVDVALEVIGLPQTMKQAVQSLAAMGRAVVAGVSDKPLEVDTYRELLCREGEVIGTMDHLLQELPLLLDVESSIFQRLSRALCHWMSMRSTRCWTISTNSVAMCAL